MFNKRWLIPCCGLPLVVGMGLLCAALAAFNMRSANESASERVDVQPTSNARLIQILGRYFDSAQISRGRAIFELHCVACHGADGQGQFPEAPLEPDSTGRIGAPPHDETGHSWHHSDTQLIRYVTDGGFSDPARFYTMPPFGEILSDEQIKQVIAYIKTLWTDDQRDMQRVLTEEEEALFSGQE